ncbi:hypothetical protein INT48_001516, partial [Thamnidium elegans]
MKRFSLSILFPYFVCAISGGNSAESSKSYPFSVTLTNPILCGGSIISLDPPWVLTAAHCIEDFNISDEVSASVAYGSRQFSDLLYTQIKRVIPHPLYVPSSIQLKAQVYATDKTDQVPYDIGLIELTQPFVETDHVNRVRLDMEEGDKNVDNKLETIGMGYTGIQELHANVLQYAHCNLSNAAPLHDNNFNNSIILITSDAGLCHGDSGSPLLYKPDNSSEYSLKGVLNRILNAFDPDPENTTCPVPYSSTTGFLNIFSKPSRHINWITSVTGLSESILTDTAAELQKKHSFSKSQSASSARANISEINWLQLLLILPLSLFHY